MLGNVRFILRDRCELEKERPTIVGVSGGPDSLCLMDVLHRAGYQIIVAHFNHRIRAEADVEAKEVESLAARLAIPFVVESTDVRQYASMNKLSLEEAARNLRYHFLFVQARHFQAQAIAVGHTADDQVETVLMHLIRGAGLTGLKGMLYRTLLPVFDPVIPVVRPLLDVWREQTIAYCASHNLTPHHDASNDSLDFLRNRLRHELIPLLETYNPRFREAVWRSARTLAADHVVLTEALEAEWKKCIDQEAEDYMAFNMSCLLEQSVALQGYLIRRAVERLRPGQEVDYGALERAAAFLDDPTGVRMDLIGGLVLLREDKDLYIARAGAQLPSGRWPQMPAQKDSISVPVPGQIVLSGGWQLTSERGRLTDSARRAAAQNGDRFRVWLDADSLPNKLELRVRRRGDLFEPLGMNGHSQKLSDFFINEKLPLRARDRWPLLCYGDEVIWIPGYWPGEAFKLKKTSRMVACFAVAPPRSAMDE